MPEAPVILITGAASGIGRRFAEDLLVGGAHRLVLADRDGDGLRAHFGDARAQLEPLDVTDLGAWRDLVGRVVAEHGRLDVVANIAGVLTPGWIWEVEDEVLDRTLDVNVKGVVYGSKVAVEQMVRQRSGHIVNMASLGGVAFMPGNAVYAASKHAVRGFTVSIAAELRRWGVAASVVCPGVVETRMLVDQVGREEGAITFATGRPLRVEEVSAALVRVLRTRAVEVCLPARSGAKLLGADPALFVRLHGVIAARGRRAAAKHRAARGG